MDATGPKTHGAWPQFTGTAIFFFNVCALVFSACGEAPRIPVAGHSQSPADASSGPPALVIAAVGDIMMAGSIQAAVSRNAGNYDLLFEKVRGDLQAADITVANLETPVDGSRPVSGYPAFNSRPGLLAALRRSGIDVVSVANNHVMDAGTGGLKRTLAAIEAAGLVPVGAGRTRKEAAAARYLVARGVKVAFLAYTYDVNQRLPRPGENRPGVCVIHEGSEADLGRAAGRVREARTNADLAVVMLHWGEEYAVQQTPWQRRVAAELAEAGADIIFGSHPHVLQPVGTIHRKDGGRTLVAYSLGNFLSSQNAGIRYRDRENEKALRGDGIILSVVIEKKDGRFHVQKAEFIPLWTLRADRRNGAVIPKPASVAREIARLGSLAKRNGEEDDLLAFLGRRQQLISGTLAQVP